MRGKQLLLVSIFVSAFVPAFGQLKGIDPTLLGKATAGDAQSEFLVAQAYAQGAGVVQDYAQAAVWYQKAAGQGVAQAQYALGVYFHIGQGVPQSDAQAADWFRQAAEQGLAAA